MEYFPKLGANTVYYGLWPEFVSEISKRISKRGIIVEGVYTSEFVDILRKTFPEAELRLLHVWAPKKRRIDFFTSRSKLGLEEAASQLRALDRIKAEVGLAKLLRCADSTLRNDSELSVFLTHEKAIAKRFFEGEPNA